MKGLKFGDNVAVIGGKRVPYSLLGALAAILGAFLVWKQFQGGGGINLGQQSPDLAGLTDLAGLGGGGGGGGAGGVDLGPGGPYPPTAVPIYDLSYPPPISGPVYGMDSGTSAVAVYNNTGPVLPHIDPIPPTHAANIAANIAGFSSTSQAVVAAHSAFEALRTPPAPAPAPAPTYLEGHGAIA